MMNSCHMLPTGRSCTPPLVPKTSPCAPKFVSKSVQSCLEVVQKMSQSCLRVVPRLFEIVPKVPSSCLKVISKCCPCSFQVVASGLHLHISNQTSQACTDHPKIEIINKDKNFPGLY